MKRLYDIICSSIGLLLLLPIIAIVAILVKIDSSGTVFFIQRRMGRNSRTFDLYKFRTMAMEAQKQGTTSDGPGVTKIGKFLRKSKLDELPHLFNVLKGDMSIVGPRLEVGKYLRNALLKFDLQLNFLTILRLVQQISFIKRTVNLIISHRKLVIISLHSSVFVASCYLAFFVRFDGVVPASQIDLFLRYLPLFIIVRVILLYIFSLDKGMWRYVNTADIINIVMATSIGSLLLFVSVRYYFEEASYPTSIFVLDGAFNIFFLTQMRMTKLMLRMAIGRRKSSDDKRVIIVGAGDAAEMLLRNIAQSHLYPYNVIGFVDDDSYKKNLKIKNIPVLGTRKDLKFIVQDERIEELIIAIPSLSQSKFNEMVKDIRQCGLPVKSVPSLWDIMSGRDTFNKIEVVDEQDILFRSLACGTIDALGVHLKGKVVMITGAGGSIGSELSRQVSLCGVEKLILFEKHEESLYMIDKELNPLVVNEKDSDEKCGLIVPVIGDVLDEGRVTEVMEEYHPQIVFHAAAYKHVPLMESNPCQAFKTNVMGTKLMAQKASEFRVERFVLISTDKAVNSVNVMGMTKMMAEIIVGYYSAKANRETLNGSRRTKYVTVRFGNVLGSSGSVVPLFREQIKNGGPVTVTHPDITRYFMTIPEAVSLVIQASDLGNGGELFVLDMGTPVKIVDLAKRMICLYGYKPNIDIDIKYIGLRPGEKLYENIFNRHEKITNTTNQKIMMATSARSYDSIILDVLELEMSSKMKVADKSDLTKIYNKLIQCKRKSARYYTSSSFPFSLKSKKEANTGKLRDICLKGFSSQLPLHLRIGERIDFELPIAINGNHKQEGLSGIAEVAWMTNGSSYRYGFKFVTVDDEQLNSLEKFLQQLPDLCV